MSEHPKKYLKLRISADDIDLDTIKKTCEITQSAISENIEIDNLGTNPQKWSREQLIKQFNLLTIYPWFWKNLLKNKANTATLEKAKVFVQIADIPGGINVPIDQLKHFDDSSAIQKKLSLKNGFIPISFYSSDGDIDLFGEKTAVLDANNNYYNIPKFSISSEGEIILNVELQLYTSWTDLNGNLHIDDDISGFYYQLDGVGRYAVSSDAYFILEFEYPRTIVSYKSKVTEYISDPSKYYNIENVSPWPPRVGFRYSAKDKHEAKADGSYDTTYYNKAMLKRINEPNTWVGPYGDNEPDLTKFGAIEKRKVEDNQNLMSSDTIAFDSYNGWYLKYDKRTFDFSWNSGDHSLGNFIDYNDSELTEIEQQTMNDTLLKPEDHRVNESNLPDKKLYMAGWYHNGEWMNSNAANTPYVEPNVDNTESFAMKLVIGDMTSKMGFSDIQDGDGPQAGNQPHTGYGRLVFQCKNRDDPMYLNSELTQSSLVVEKADTTTYEYGVMNQLLYVQDTNRFVDSNGNTKQFGEQLVSYIHNVYFSHDKDNQKPTSTRWGILIEAKQNTNEMKGCYGNFNNNTPEGDSSIKTIDQEVIQIIVNRATNYWNKLNKPEDQLNPSVDNLQQVYDGIGFGAVTNPNQVFDLFNIESFDNILPIIEESTNKILYRVIKLANIWILNSGTTQFLSQPLINNGIIIIKNGAKLVVRTKLGGDVNAHAHIQNNGIIIRESGGILELEEPGVAGQVLLKHESNLSDNPFTYSEKDIRDLKDTLHSIIVPSKTKSMVCRISLQYRSETDDIYSNTNSVVVSTNASDSVLPVWNNNDKQLEFKMVTPTLSYGGVLSRLFYKIFIPDYLVFKWWETSREVIEDSLLGKDGQPPLLTARAQDPNAYENGEVVENQINVITDKVTNYSMSGLLVTLDLYGDGGDITIS